MYLISEALSIYTFQPHIKELFMHLNELPKESEESVQTTYYYKVRNFEKNTSANFRRRRKRLQLTQRERVLHKTPKTPPTRQTKRLSTLENSDKKIKKAKNS